MFKKTVNTSRKLAFSGVALALAFVLSYIKLWDMPTGGSVTLFSMFFVSIIGYFYGPVWGSLVGFVYSLLQMIQSFYFLSVPQVLLDYTFAFTALGLSGFFHHKKYGLQIGYLVAISARFICSTLAGIVFYSEIVDASGIWPAVWASAIYNGGYIYAEGIITLIIIFIPALYKQICRMKVLANK